MNQVFHQSPEDELAHCFFTKWLHKSCPPRVKRSRRRAPAWAKVLLKDRDASVVFDQAIPCPSCGVLVTGLDGGRGEIDNGGPVDVIRCSRCLAMVVLDLRAGLIRAPTEAERRRWRLTFWFVAMRDAEGD